MLHFAFDIEESCLISMVRSFQLKIMEPQASYTLIRHMVEYMLKHNFANLLVSFSKSSGKDFENWNHFASSLNTSKFDFSPVENLKELSSFHLDSHLFVVKSNIKI